MNSNRQALTKRPPIDHINYDCNCFTLNKYNDKPLQLKLNDVATLDNADYIMCTLLMTAQSNGSKEETR